MKTLFIATSNKGKQAEIKKYAEQYGNEIKVIFPDSATEITVDETGTTFEQNALLKAEAYRAALNDPDIIYVGDDSGIKIRALNDQPGVFTRRWAGYEMTDAEIVDYCLSEMKDVATGDRDATFETVLAVLRADTAPAYFGGKVNGHILETPLDTDVQPGFPFRSIFWVDEVNRPFYEIHSLALADRSGFLMHREKAFKQLFESVQARAKFVPVIMLYRAEQRSFCKTSRLPT